MNDWSCCNPVGRCDRGHGCPAGGGCHHSPDCQDIHCPGRPSSRADRNAPSEPTTLLHWAWGMVFVVGFFALIALLQELDGRHTERGAEHAEQCNP